MPITPPTLAPIVVAIPCYNEAAAIRQVIEEWRAALPEAEIVVFDNNSNDGTGAIAEKLGVRVVPVPEQGKGCAVRKIFEVLAERDAVIMIDGDGTYPASAVGALLEPVLSNRADMAVGVRRPVDQAGALTPTRWIGNRIIRSAFRLLIGPGHPDLLSGYRVFAPSFLQSFKPRSVGFEIETELGCEAVTRKLRVAAVDVDYYPRIAGTISKLKAFRDGRRILTMIVLEGLRLRPWRAYFVLAAPLVVVALAAGLRITAIVIPVVLAPMILGIVTRLRHETLGTATP